MSKQLIKQENNFSWIKYVVILAIMIILFGVGAKFDFDICVGINAKIKAEALGRAVTAFLAWICLSGGLFFGWCFFINGIKCWKEKKVLMTFGLIFVLIFMACFMYFNYDDIHPELLKAFGGSSSKVAVKASMWCFIIMGAISLFGTFMFANWATKQVEINLMLKVALIAMVCGIVIMGAKEFLKILWSRPRPSWVLEHESSFKYVWELQPFECFKAPDLEYRDQLKSFPSGHTSAGMTGVAAAVMFNCLPIVKTKKSKNIIFFVTIALVVLIQFNRMIACCHFLTDVTFAFIVGITISFFAPFFLKIKSKNVKTFKNN